MIVLLLGNHNTLTLYTGTGRPRVWAWKVPRDRGMELVRVEELADGSLIRSGSGSLWA